MHTFGFTMRPGESSYETNNGNRLNHMLNSYSVSPPLPQQPAFFIGSRTELNMHIYDKSTKSNHGPLMLLQSLSYALVK